MRHKTKKDNQSGKKPRLKSFTNSLSGVIIFYVKATKFFKCALAAICAAAIIAPATVIAAADDGDEEAPVYPAGSTIYPAEFTHDLSAVLDEKVTDFAVDGENVAFATGTYVYSLFIDTDGERKCKSYQHEQPITALDYENGQLYLNTAVSIYLYPQLTITESHEFKDARFPIVADDLSYYYTYTNSSKELTYWREGEPQSCGEGFTHVKNYGGGKVYALKGGLPYKIEGATATAMSLTYTDFTDADKIKTSGTAHTLKDNSYTVKTADIKEGAYVTKIDDKVIGDNFKQSGDGATKKSEGVPCLVLCESGNASIIATNEGMFITATSSLKETPYSAHSDARVGKTFYSVEEIGIYSRPYISESTRISTLKSGSQHVVKVIESFHLDYISVDFLKVTYTQGSETVTGFVAANFLTEYSFAAEDLTPAEPDSSDFKFETNVLSVILAVVIVALIIIAVLYLAAKLNKKDGKKKKKAKRKDKDDEDDDE